MASTFSLDLSPPVNRQMGTTLDRDYFRKTITVLAARFPAKSVGAAKLADELKQSVLDLPKIPSVKPDPTSADCRLIRLCKEEHIPEAAMGYLKRHSEGLTEYNLQLGYDHWNLDEILQAILPEELCAGAPVGFSSTGHIAHVNLSDEYLPYKHLIGELILDKNRRLKTVVNKLNQIHDQFRFFAMELIAGEDNYVVEHHESDCAFTFDFTRVYWNSRLHTEHKRMIDMFKPEDVIVDVMAGVGPFAVPAGRRGCAVLANDLNPESHKYLQHNITANKAEAFVRPFCEDGRTFIPRSIQLLMDDPMAGYQGPPISKARERRDRERGIAKPSTPPAPPRKRVSHFLMNLPDSAITFVDAYRGILAQSGEIGEEYEGHLPMVHCYCFTREAEPDAAAADIRQRVEEVLGDKLEEDVSFHHVRAVAPNKEMYCISFRLPHKVAYARI
ncbi:Met-10+ like-protein-domain-containing protein [Pterulicium gracile]|uniref:tRNA (guanine(37)-N1)-methyltransferase n=1 Tax=Pterulicium gracile TaxID=1884261 RepID=A0A5C3QNU2_9AGAR|nr:Met-10+ like-protein-domain-containing protein [Pterula gracilis]